MNATQTKVLENFVRVGSGQNFALASGFNSIDVPAGHDIVLIVPRPPNPGETVPTLTLKGLTGDTGVVLSGYFPSCLCLAVEGADIGITASAAWSAEIAFGKTETGPVT